MPAFPHPLPLRPGLAGRASACGRGDDHLTRFVTITCFRTREPIRHRRHRIGRPRSRAGGAAGADRHDRRLRGRAAVRGQDRRNAAGRVPRRSPSWPHSSTMEGSTSRSQRCTPLDEVQEAYRELARSHTLGKIVPSPELRHRPSTTTRTLLRIALDAAFSKWSPPMRTQHCLPADSGRRRSAASKAGDHCDTGSGGEDAHGCLEHQDDPFGPCWWPGPYRRRLEVLRLTLPGDSPC